MSLDALELHRARVEEVNARIDDELITRQRLIDSHVDLVELVDQLRRRLDVWETWAQDPTQPFPGVGTRLRDLELKLAVDHKAVIAGLVDEIRRDPQLRELLRGPRGRTGDDGQPGPKGDNAATVIREVKISG